MYSKWLESWLKENDHKGLLEVLLEVQHREQFLSRENLEYVSKAKEIPLAKIYSVATFYSEFRLEQRGKHVIRLCTGTACLVKGNNVNLNFLKTELNLVPGKTTPDNLFTLEGVNCLGTCSLAPVVSIDGKIYPNVSIEKLSELIEKIRKAER
ncbi:MAG: NAD(P)H-dependent oxidoreductase subunit E [archaeon]